MDLGTGVAKARSFLLERALLSRPINFSAYCGMLVGSRRRRRSVQRLQENSPNPLFYFYNFDNSPPTRSGISMFPALPTLGLEVSF